MSDHPVGARRCVSCNRWAGERSPGSAPEHVFVKDDAAKGLCTEGPWHGTPRGVRNACGQWVRWFGLGDQPDGADQLRNRASS